MRNGIYGAVLRVLFFVLLVIGLCTYGYAGPPVMTLSSGWNFISLPKTPPDSAITAILSDVSLKVHIVWGWDNQSQQWKRWAPGGLSNTLLSMELGKGYWIYMKNEGEINMAEWAPVVSFLPANFSPKWNLIGYNGADGLSVSDALQAISGQQRSVWNWTAGTWYAQHATIPSLPPGIEALTGLSQGKAYWVRMKDSYVAQSAVWDTSLWDNSPWGP